MHIHSTHGNFRKATVHSNKHTSIVVEGVRFSIQKTSNFNKGGREHWQSYYLAAILNY